MITQEFIEAAQASFTNTDVVHSSLVQQEDTLVFSVEYAGARETRFQASCQVSEEALAEEYVSKIKEIGESLLAYDPNAKHLLRFRRLRAVTL